MKKFVLGILSVIGLISCSNTTYYRELQTEKNLIDDYIKRQGINIIYEEPTTDVWPENDYLQIADYCYFHLTKRGDKTGDTLRLNTTTVLLRYKRYTLDAEPDTIFYWTANDAPSPIEFKYCSSATSVVSYGWLLAIAELRYNEAEGKLICPSKLGFDNDQSDVIPYGYDLKLKIKH